MSTMHYSIKLILFSLSLFLFSCDSLTTDVDVDDSDFAEQMVVSGFITAGSQSFDFLVAQSRGFLDSGDFDEYNVSASDIRVVKEATQDMLTLTEHGVERPESSRGNYLFSSFPIDYFEPGDYTFTVEQSKYGTSETTLTMPQYGLLENIEYTHEAGSTFEGEDSSSIEFDIVDDPDVTNYYEVQFYTTDRVINYLTTLDPSALSGPSGRTLIISDETFGKDENKNLEIKFDRYNFDPDGEDELFVRWSAVSEGYYIYVKSLDRHQQGIDNPFNSAVQVYSNVNNALGTIGLKASVDIKVTP